VDVSNEGYKFIIHVKKQVGATMDVHIFSDMVEDMMMLKWLSRETLIAMSTLLTHFQ